MLYRFAIALGLLFIGVHVGREIARTKPVRLALREPRNTPRPERVESSRVRKISVH